MAFSATGDWARILERGGAGAAARARRPGDVAGGPMLIRRWRSAWSGCCSCSRWRSTRGLSTRRGPSPAALTLLSISRGRGRRRGGRHVLALIAPLLFDWVYEHAILLLAAALLLPQHRLLPRTTWLWSDRGAASLAGGGARRAPPQSSPGALHSPRRRRRTTVLTLVLAIELVGLVLLGVRWAYAAVLALLMLGQGGCPRSSSASREAARAAISASTR